jgi:selenocysteine lyase/cysteine desulfurase
VEVVTGSEHAGLVTFRLIHDAAEGMQPDGLVRELARRSILIRSIERLGALRLSMGFFNTGDELSEAVDAVSELVSTR